MCRCIWKKWIEKWIEIFHSPCRGAIQVMETTSGLFRSEWNWAMISIRGKHLRYSTCLLPSMCLACRSVDAQLDTSCAPFWQDLAEPNKVDSCLSVCVCVCVTGPSVTSESAVESGGCQVAPRGMARWNMAATERGVLKVVCAQSPLACVLVRMRERVDRRPARWASIASRCWGDGPAAGLWLKRFHPSEKTANLKNPPNLSDAAFNLLNL